MRSWPYWSPSCWPMTDKIDGEQWKPVSITKGGVRYEASNHGRIRSVGFECPCGRKHRGRILKQRVVCAKGLFKGHLYVTIDRPRGVHTLVADAFLGPRPRGLVVCHNNGDSFDNRPENLRYDSQKENIRDTIRHGSARIGAKNHGSRLSAGEVDRVKDLLASGCMPAVIAKWLGIGRKRIVDIKLGHAWKHAAALSW